MSTESGPASRRLDVLGMRSYLALTVGLAAVIGLAGVLMQRRYSQFFADDFLYLQLSRDGELTPDWLVINNYGHFAPLTRLAYFVLQRDVRPRLRDGEPAACGDRRRRSSSPSSGCSPSCSAGARWRWYWP